MRSTSHKRPLFAKVGTRKTPPRLVGLGIPEIEAKRYVGKLKSGNYLIAVHASDGDQEDRAKEIFENAGAEDICTSSMSKAPAEATA